MTTVYERLEIGLAIDRLVKNPSEPVAEDIKKIIHFGDKITIKHNRKRPEVEMVRNPKRNTVSGFSTTGKNVEITDENPPNKAVVKNKPFVERIGNYKIWKENLGIICFRHFWKSDLATSDSGEDRSKIYAIHYSPSSFKLISIYNYHPELVFELSFFNYGLEYYESKVKLFYGELGKETLKAKYFSFFIL